MNRSHFARILMVVALVVIGGALAAMTTRATAAGVGDSLQVGSVYRLQNQIFCESPQVAKEIVTGADDNHLDGAATQRSKRATCIRLSVAQLMFEGIKETFISDGFVYQILMWTDAEATIYSVRLIGTDV